MVYVRKRVAIKHAKECGGRVVAVYSSYKKCQLGCACIEVPRRRIGWSIVLK